MSRRPPAWIAVAMAVVIGGAARSEPLSAPLATPSFTDALRASGQATLDALRDDDLPAIEARFGEPMREAMPRERLNQTAERMRADLGTLRRCDEPVARLRQGVVVVSYVCEFSIAPATVTIAWNDGGEIVGLFMAPVPPKPLAVALPPGTRETALTTGATGWPLPATLLMPGTPQRPPVALFVHGSGPNDRDETIGPNKPFRDLAVGLAAQGIGSLRYDKRTRALGERFVSELKDWTLDDEIVDDAVAALALLAARADVGPIFVVGHSEGAWLAPRIAARAAAHGVAVAGVVMLAGNVTPLVDLLVDQYEFGAAQPTPTATRELVDDVKRRRDEVRRLLQTGSPRAGAALPLDLPASAWLDIGRYDPAATLRAQPALPALLTFGERDFQVPIREKALWEARLRDRPDTTIVGYPGVNHLLIEGVGPMSAAEYAKPGRVAQGLIDGVATWIAAHAGGAGR